MHFGVTCADNLLPLIERELTPRAYASIEDLAKAWSVEE